MSSKTPRHPGRETFNGVCCTAPLVLAILALSFVMQNAMTHGYAASLVEGLRAPLFLALLAAQVMLIAFFAFTADWKAPARSLRMLGVQLAGLCAPFAALGLWQLASAG